MLRECVNHTVQALTSAGVSATSDARNLALPGVWITPDVVAIDTLDDGAAVTLALILVTGTAPDQALTDLDDLLGHVTATLTPNRDWTAASIRLPNHSPEPLPALRGTVTLTWTRDA